MNICFVSVVTYWHGLKGGMDLHGRHLLEGLSQKGHNVTVLSTRHPEGRTGEEVNGVRVHYLDQTVFGSPRKGWFKQSASAFARLDDQESFDMLVSQSIAGAGLWKTAKQRNIPLVSIMHGYETMILRSHLNLVRNFGTGYASLIKSFLSCFYYSLFYEFPLLAHSNVVITPSHTVADVLRRRPFLRKRNIRVVPYGIDIKRFRPSLELRQTTRQRLHIADDEIVILFLSLISRQKGADVALRALTRLRNKAKVRLILAGDGEYLNEAKRLSADLGLEPLVIFPGFVPNEATSEYYNACDVFIFPTLRVESFGIVVAEAMACGKPIVASRIGALPEVIDDGTNGVLVPPGDADALGEQLALLISDPGRLADMGKQAQAKAAKHFTQERMIAETTAILKAAAGENR